MSSESREAATAPAPGRPGAGRSETLGRELEDRPPGADRDQGDSPTGGEVLADVTAFETPRPAGVVDASEPWLVIPDRKGFRGRWLAWGGALLLAGVVGLSLWWNRQRAGRENEGLARGTPVTEARASSAGDASDRDPSEAGAGDAVAEKAVAEKTAPSEEPRAAEEQARLLDRRLTDLGTQLGRIVEQEGLFPAGTVPGGELPLSQRLSWLALLASRGDGAAVPHWEAAWNSPINDRFVRRQIPEFHNPRLSGLVGEDGYPAGHFAGLTGVAEELMPAVAPRRRRGVLQGESGVSPAEVVDGLGETILVTGVTRELGSWGAGGRPTLREFSGPPVIEGPDGLGTGTPEMLLVLMADGRVQTISAEIDPLVFASLVAVGDREPAVEPGPPRAGGPGDNDNGEAALGEPTGWLPEFASTEEGAWLTIDIEERLGLVLLSVEQPPATRETVLRLLEGLVGVPIRWEGMAQDEVQATLRESVSLSQKKVSVRQVLDAVFKETPLTWRVQGASIRIQPRNNQAMPGGNASDPPPPGSER